MQECRIAIMLPEQSQNGFSFLLDSLGESELIS
jgi:hypothetical protein